MLGFVVESTKLGPFADARAALTAERQAKIAAGWVVDEIGPSVAHCFARKGGERVMIGIERMEPRDPVECPECG